ncbi:MAG TPA: UPF0182 family protein, partial [Gemmatimonadales bacterium]
MTASSGMRAAMSRRPRRRALLVLILAVVLLFVLVPLLVRLAADWFWFGSLGYERVFATRLVAEALLGLTVGAVAAAFLYVNLRMAQRGLVPDPLVVRLGAATPPWDVTRLLQRLALPVALGLGLLFGLAGASEWLDVLRFVHRTPFGVSDPVFARDVAYYVFTVPVASDALALITTLATLTVMIVATLYVLRRDVVVFRRTVTVEPAARLHLALLVALMFLTAALRVYFVRIPGLLYSTTGPLVGASYADLHGGLLGLRLVAIAALGGAVLVLLGARTQRLGRNTLIAVGLYFGVSLLGVGLYPA